MRPVQLFTSALLCAAASTAWSPLQDTEAIIEPRQNDVASSTSSSFDLSVTNQEGNTATTITSSAALSSNTGSASITSTGSDSNSDSNSQSGSTSNSGSQSDSSETSTKSSQATTQTYDARLPAGGVSLITPAAIATSYYKIRDNVTFAWNYTSLSATPSAVDVLASCSQNSEIYTIASNLTIANATQTLTWDTGAFQTSATVQLLTAEYTLIIHDAAKDASAVAQAGYLGTFNSFVFGMYLPQPEVPLSEFKCPTCNGAGTLMDKHTMSFMCGMAALTVLSFGWFSGIAGLW